MGQLDWIRRLVAADHSKILMEMPRPRHGHIHHLDVDQEDTHNGTQQDDNSIRSTHCVSLMQVLACRLY